MQYSAPLVAEQASQAGCLCRKLLAHLLNQQCPQLPLLLLLPLQLLLLLLLDVLSCLSSLSPSVFVRPCHPSRPNSLDLFTQDNI